MRHEFLAVLFSFSTVSLVACSSSDDSEGDSGDGASQDEAMAPDDSMSNPGRPPGPDETNDPADGGSGDGDEEMQAEEPPETSQPDAATCADQEDWDPAWVALEDQILTIVNMHRQSGASCGGEQFAPTEPLVMDDALRCAARLHSKDMVDQNYFDHGSLDGRSPWDRIEAAGFEHSAGGENIAAGHETAEGTMEGWMSSPGHCSNIMDPDFDFIGVGYYPGGDFRHMWTQTFGSEGNSWR